MIAYDEELVLYQYLWEHSTNSMTDFEQCVAKAIIGRIKAQESHHPDTAQLLAQRWGKVGDLDVDAALADGFDAFRRRVAQRVVAEFGTQLFVNRCPRCNRIIRTPQARQCFWCGHDWHDTAVPK